MDTNQYRMQGTDYNLRTVKIMDQELYIHIHIIIIQFDNLYITLGLFLLHIVRPFLLL